MHCACRLDLTLSVSSRRYLTFLCSCPVSSLLTRNVSIASKMHINAILCILQLNTTLLHCILYLTEYFYNPGFLPDSALQCILRNMYLGSDVS